MFENRHIIPFSDGEIHYWKKIISHETDLFKSVYNDINWRQDSIRVMGKTHLTPRLHSWIAAPEIKYTYSGTTLQNEAWNPTLRELKSLCENASKFQYNSLLANFYRTGKDSNGWHADNEKELGYDPTIAMISLGETRRFTIRENRNHKNKLDFDLPSGSLIVMKGLQHCTQHCLRKTAKICDPRISLTFRFTYPNNSN